MRVRLHGLHGCHGNGVVMCRPNVSSPGVELWLQPLHLTDCTVSPLHGLMYSLSWRWSTFQSVYFQYIHTTIKRKVDTKLQIVTETCIVMGVNMVLATFALYTWLYVMIMYINCHKDKELLYKSFYGDKWTTCSQKYVYVIYKICAWIFLSTYYPRTFRNQRLKL